MPSSARGETRVPSCSHSYCSWGLSFFLFPIHKFSMTRSSYHGTTHMTASATYVHIYIDPLKYLPLWKKKVHQTIGCIVLAMKSRCSSWLWGPATIAIDKCGVMQTVLAMKSGRTKSRWWSSGSHFCWHTLEHEAHFVRPTLKQQGEGSESLVNYIINKWYDLFVWRIAALQAPQTTVVYWWQCAPTVIT